MRLTAQQVRRFSPYSRFPARRGRNHYKTLREMVLFAPAEELEPLGLFLARAIAMIGAFDTPYNLDRHCTALSARFGPEAVLPFWLQALHYQKRDADAIARATEAAERMPHSASIQMQLVQSLFLIGRVADAGRHLRAAFDTLMQGPERGRRATVEMLIELGMTDWLKAQPGIAGQFPQIARATAFGPVRDEIDVLCISLRSAGARLKAARYGARGAGRFTHVEGVYGRDLPRSAIDVLTHGRSAAMTASEVGCTLSHLRAWEEVARLCGAQDYALVLEDDARFIHGPGIGLSETLAAARAAAAGLVFVNSRACEKVCRTEPHSEVRLIPLGQATQGRLRPTNPGWGTDGYLLNGPMAAQLVQLWTRIGIAGALDWQMCLMCLDPDETDPPGHCRTMAETLRAEALRWTPLGGHVSDTPLIRSRDHGISSLNLES